MKKSKFIIIGFISLLLMSSCNDWLTVSPKTEVISKDLFTSEEGFKDALTGVYIQMKSNRAYGAALSMTTIEYLVSNWDSQPGSTEQHLSRYNYTDAGVETTLASIYSQEYKIIASINAILDQIDNAKDLFTTTGTYELIKGECLALRAYCHFDILRLFGPVPTESTSDVILPYVKTVSKKLNLHITYDQFMEELTTDLTQAETLLESVDPIKDYSLAELSRPGSGSGDRKFDPKNDHFAFRYLQMNYYAVKALQARAYLWFNNTTEAHTCAKVLIDAVNHDGSKKFLLGTAADMSAADYNLSKEHIFGLYDFDLNSKYTNLFSNGTLKRYSSDYYVKNQLYGNTGTDIRELNLWVEITQRNGTGIYICRKYKVNILAPTHAIDDLRKISMLRLSEMYFIAIETAPLGEAQSLWDEFKGARNIASSVLTSDLNQVQNELIKEYRKEFLAEGQAFYAYKRVNAPKSAIIWASYYANLDYNIPLPKSELIQTN
jgi:hypothetical protein